MTQHYTSQLPAIERIASAQDIAPQVLTYYAHCSNWYYCNYPSKDPVLRQWAVERTVWNYFWGNDRFNFPGIKPRNEDQNDTEFEMAYWNQTMPDTSPAIVLPQQVLDDDFPDIQIQEPGYRHRATANSPSDWVPSHCVMLAGNQYPSHDDVHMSGASSTQADLDTPGTLQSPDNFPLLHFRRSESLEVLCSKSAPANSPSLYHSAHVSGSSSCSIGGEGTAKRVDQQLENVQENLRRSYREMENSEDGSNGESCSVKKRRMG